MCRTVNCLSELLQWDSPPRRVIITLIWLSVHLLLFVTQKNECSRTFFPQSFGENPPLSKMEEWILLVKISADNSDGYQAAER